MEDVKVKSNYKDTIFRMLFSDKENLLSLYNALNGTGGRQMRSISGMASSDLAGDAMRRVPLPY